MLNSKGERELAYVVLIDEIKPIEGYDRVEYARVGGWWVIVKKDQFKVGDTAIYIEVDAKVPEKEPFMFLEPKKFKIKTLKMCKVISQGLLMHPNDFGWDVLEDGTVDIKRHINTSSLAVGDFVTQLLEITYADAEDNKRKAPSEDKYKKMVHAVPSRKSGDRSRHQSSGKRSRLVGNYGKTFVSARLSNRRSGARLFATGGVTIPRSFSSFGYGKSGGADLCGTGGR